MSLIPRAVTFDPFDGPDRFVGKARRAARYRRIGQAAQRRPTGRSGSPKAGLLWPVTAMRSAYGTPAPRREPHDSHRPNQSRSNGSKVAALGITASRDTGLPVVADNTLGAACAKPVASGCRQCAVLPNSGLLRPAHADTDPARCVGTDIVNRVTLTPT